MRSSALCKQIQIQFAGITFQPAYSHLAQGFVKKERRRRRNVEQMTCYMAVMQAYWRQVPPAGPAFHWNPGSSHHLLKPISTPPLEGGRCKRWPPGGETLPGLNHSPTQACLFVGNLHPGNI